MLCLLVEKRKLVIHYWLRLSFFYIFAMGKFDKNRQKNDKSGRETDIEERSEVQWR